MKNIVLLFILLNFSFKFLAKGNDTIPFFSHNTSFGYTNQKFFGDNIYNHYHDNFKGIYIKTGILIFRYFSIDISAERYSGKITNKTIINEDKTTFVDKTFSASYAFYPMEVISVSPSLFYKSVRGKNQGKFYGSGFGIGADIKYHFVKHLYINIGANLGKMHFDIKAPSDIEDQFVNAYFVNFYAGLGLRLY